MLSAPLFDCWQSRLTGISDMLLPKSTSSKYSVMAIVIKLSFSLVFLILVLRKFDLITILNQIRTADPFWVIFAALIFILNTALLAWRWSLLSLGSISFYNALNYTWIGLFFGGVIPGGVSGDVAKGVSLAIKHKASRNINLPASIVCDKLVGLCVLALFFLGSALSILFGERSIPDPLHNAILYSLLLVLFAIVGSLVAMRIAIARIKFQPDSLVQNSKAGRMFNAFAVLPQLYLNRGPLLAKAALVSAAGHAANAIAHLFIMKSINLHAGLPFAFVLYSVLSVVTMLPISISGVGVRDIVAAGLFTVFGFHSEAGIAFAWIVLAINIPMVAIGGLVQCYELFANRRVVS
jgi:glycosyltransferase 2 family protein